MPKLKRVIIAHGDGPKAKKVVNHATKGRHKNVHFEGYDPQTNLERIKQALKRKGGQPNNLTLKRNCSISELKRKQANSVDIQYAISMASEMPFYTRREFFKEVFRTLKPGGRFIVVENEVVGEETKRELEKAGFKTSLKILSREEERKLDSDTINDMDVFVPIEAVREMKQFFFEEFISIEKNPTHEVVESIKRVCDKIKPGRVMQARIIARK